MEVLFCVFSVNLQYVLIHITFLKLTRMNVYMTITMFIFKFTSLWIIDTWLFKTASSNNAYETKWCPQLRKLQKLDSLVKPKRKGFNEQTVQLVSVGSKSAHRNTWASEKVQCLGPYITSRHTGHVGYYQHQPLSHRLWSFLVWRYLLASNVSSPNSPQLVFFFLLMQQNNCSFCFNR